VAIQIAVVIAIMTPWVLRNRVVMGRPCLATIVGGYTFLGAHCETAYRDPKMIGLWSAEVFPPEGASLTDGSEVQLEAIAWKQGWTFVERHLADIPKLEAWKLYRLLTPFEDTPNRVVYWGFALAWIVTVPFLLVGLKESFRQNRAETFVLMVPVWAVLLCTLVFYGSVRFRHTAEPMLMMFAALGGVQLCTWASRLWAARVQAWRMIPQNDLDLTRAAKH
jgi:hypothetical protein